MNRIVENTLRGVRFLLLGTLLSLAAVPGFAQDTKTLFEAIVLLENSLKEMIAEESGKREAALRSLREELAELKTETHASPQDVEANEAMAAHLQTLVGELKGYLGELDAPEVPAPPEPQAPVEADPAPPPHAEGPAAPAAEAASAPAEKDGEAQDEIDRLKERVEALAEQLEALTHRQEKAESFIKKHRINVSGKVYAGYFWNYTGTAGQRDLNGFTIDRMYLTLKGRLSGRFSYRGTTDIYTSKADANLSAVVILKYAYVDWKANDWLKLRGGVIQTPWIDYMNKAWGYRGVAKVLADQEKFQSSSDLGVAGIATLPGKLGEVWVSLHNGTGNKKKEKDRYKDVAARVVLKPFRKAGKALRPLEVAAHAYEGRFSHGERRARWGGLALYRHDAFSLGINYDARRDSTVNGAGVSVFGELKLGFVEGLKGFSVIGRWERYDPDQDKPDNHLHRQIAGLVYKPNGKLALVFNVHTVTKGTAAYERYDGTMVDQDGRYEMRAIVSF